MGMPPTMEIDRMMTSPTIPTHMTLTRTHNENTTKVTEGPQHKIVSLSPQTKAANKTGNAHIHANTIQSEFLQGEWWEPRLKS